MEFNQSGYGSSANGTEYWSTHRSKISDLYKSEQHFFIPTMSKVKSVLDLGCAAGGGLRFTRELNPTVEYTGLDISEELIAIAEKRFSNESNARFINFDGINLPVESNSVEFLFSFGVFHHLTDWKKMTHETLRVSSRFVLFDLRLWSNESLTGSPISYQKIALGEEDWDGKTVIQYNIQSFNELFAFLTSLKEKFISSRLYGYYTKPTHFATTPAKEVLMLAVLLEKNTFTPRIEIMIE